MQSLYGCPILQNQKGPATIVKIISSATDGTKPKIQRKERLVQAGNWILRRFKVLSVKRTDISLRQTISAGRGAILPNGTGATGS